MVRLLLLRHAKAAPDSGSGDADRALTPRGRRDAARIGRWLAREGLVPDAAVVSDARRTRETFEALQAELPANPTVSFEPDLYLASAEDVLDRLRATSPGVGILLAIGHNPGFGELAVSLAGSGDVALRSDIFHRYPTCALSVIDFENGWRGVRFGTGRLQRFVTPAQLREAAASQSQD
jgi:phosphohistidine phosphatase